MVLDNLLKKVKSMNLKNWICCQRSALKRARASGHTLRVSSASLTLIGNEEKQS